MMGCERAGDLRAYVDGELDPATSARIEGHLATCAACRERLDQACASAAAVAHRLQALAPEVAALAAQEARVRAVIAARLQGEAGAPTARGDETDRRKWQMLIHALSFRQRLAVAAALLAVLLAGLAVVPAGRVAAVGFLNLFRVQRFAVIRIDSRQPFTGLTHLGQLGTVKLPPQTSPDGVGVASLEEVEKQVGFKVKRPTVLPPGIANAPHVRVTRAVEASFTVERQKAETYLRSIGASNPTVPARLDGARLVVRVPAAAILFYGDGNGEPRLIVAELPSPTATVEGGASLAELREFLLGLPGLPADTIAQLRAIDDWTATLPVPVPVDRAIWREVSINGTPALILADRTGLAGGVVWQRDGIVHGIGGPLTERQLLDIAQSFK
ncbi:MAG: zf-HC2 domain-containing protein [Chloroflexi bacterium]|nr:zf-HC2 domain-containing protein [Chloroflexota bacterium]